MKKNRFIPVIIVSLCILMISGCNRQEEIDVDIEICSEYFIASVNDVFANFDEYYGQVVKIEGEFWVHGFDTIYRSVVRNDMSC